MERIFGQWGTRAPGYWNTMKLRDLFNDDARMDPQARGVEVAGLSADSRSVKPGDLFFALAGLKTDGARSRLPRQDFIRASQRRSRR